MVMRQQQRLWHNTRGSRTDRWGRDREGSIREALHNNNNNNIGLRWVKAAEEWWVNSVASWWVVWLLWHGMAEFRLRTCCYCMWQPDGRCTLERRSPGLWLGYVPAGGQA